MGICQSDSGDVRLTLGRLTWSRFTRTSFEQRRILPKPNRARLLEAQNQINPICQRNARIHPTQHRQLTCVTQMHKSHGHVFPLATQSRCQSKTIPIILASGGVNVSRLWDETSFPLSSPPNTKWNSNTIWCGAEFMKKVGESSVDIYVPTWWHSSSRIPGEFRQNSGGILAEYKSSTARVC